MGNKNYLRIGLCFLFSGLICANLSANENRWQDALAVDGFYTLDLTYTDDTIPVISNGNIPRVLDENEFTLKNSIFGLQVKLELTSDLSVFVQGSTFYDQQNEFDKSLDWAYLSYDLGHNYDIRLGRFLVPFLQGTELKSVGYSRLWARPLVPGSGSGGFIDNRGIELIKRVPLEDSFLSLQLSLGEPKHQSRMVDGELLGLVAVKYETRGFWLRGALAHAGYEVSTLHGQTIEDKASANMISIETEIRFQDLVVNAGFSDSDAEVSPDDKLSYLSLAYPMGSFTPYILATRTSRKFEAFAAPAPPSSAPPPPGGGPPQRRVGDSDRDTLGIGFRYDLGGAYAIKAQIERIEIADESDPLRGSVVSEANVFTVLLEGVF
ncbi:MAG: hypothetical protein KZQ90_05285 [Candidatus Thiodiazotropha sp. (ex Codakia rugifera)]|nr:hypothetical protein [Candidatus Thiodiazotropha sp. (ex Codakia rugifera)]